MDRDRRPWGDRLRARREKYALAMAAPGAHGGFESRWKTVDGVRVHSRASVEPAGRPPILLVHGLAVSHRYMMPVAQRLAASHDVHVIDLPGFGLSSEPGWVLDVRENADYLAAWLEAVGLLRVAVLGNSFGCQVAVDLAVRYPARVSLLVLVGPTMDPEARTAPRQILRWLRDVRHEDLFQTPIVLRDLANAGAGRAAKTLALALRDPIEHKLPEVQVPALVTRGGVEPVVSQRWAELAARLLPLGELAVLPGSPHNANYTAADQLAGVVLPFLARTVRGAH